MRSSTSPIDRSARRRLVGAVLALALLAAACGGSATVSETGNDDANAADPASSPEPTIDPIEPTAAPVAPDETDSPDADPTAPDAQTAPTAGPAPTTAPDATTVPTVDLEPADFNVDNIVALSPDGRFAYAGTTSPWNPDTACGAAPFESLAFVPLASAIAGDASAYAAGIEQAGDVRQLLVGPDSSAALLTSCGPFEESTVWMQKVELEVDGSLTTAGDVVELSVDGESDPYLTRWIDADTVEVRVIIEVDPDDFDSWIVERRQVSVTTGQVLATEQFGYNDDDGFASSGTFTTSDGHTYRVADDPEGSLGCEGFGVAQTLELVVDDGVQSAFDGPAQIFSTIDELHTAPTGHIAWTSGCEGYVTAFVGLVQTDGTIADAHRIDTYSLEGQVDDYADYFYYRLTDDGHLAAVGLRYDSSSGEPEPAFLRYDLATDPNFVNTAEPPVEIGAEPLFEAIEDGGTWHVGETLATNRACGGTTLYGRIDDAYLRAFPAGVELDEIVDVDLADIHTIEYEDGDDYVSRTVVVATECPGEYDGRRVWFGIESDQVVWGLSFQQADLGEVADVLSVRHVLDDTGRFVDSSVVEVRLFDGSTVEVELTAVPFE